MGLGDSAWLESQVTLLHPAANWSAQYVGESLKYVLVFVALLTTLYWLAFTLFHQIKDITTLKRATLSSCVVSLVHGTFTSITGVWLLWKASPFHFDDRGVPDANFILQFSTAYMITDFAMFLIPYTPHDYLFVIHHIITGWYMSTTVVLNRAQYSCMVWLVTGEITSPLFNSWTAARELRRTHPSAMVVYDVLSPFYTLAFVVMRIVVALPLWLWWCRGIVNDCNNVHPSYRLVWIILVSFGVVGGLIWSYKLIKGYMRKASKKPKAT